MARAIIAQFQPRHDWLIRTAAFPPGVTERDRQWHWLASGSRTPTKPVVLLVRDPVDRFVTACQQTRIHQGDIDAAIASLLTDAPFSRTRPPGVAREEWDAERNERRALSARQAARRSQLIAAGKPVPPARDRGRLRQNVHFFPQSGYIVGKTTCFRFPRDIAEAAAFLGISVPMPEANKAKRQKPTLTPKQEDSVREYYADDISLFESIAQPATVIAKPSEREKEIGDM